MGIPKPVYQIHTCYKCILFVGEYSGSPIAHTAAVARSVRTHSCVLCLDMWGGNGFHILVLYALACEVGMFFTFQYSMPLHVRWEWSSHCTILCHGIWGGDDFHIVPWDVRCGWPVSFLVSQTFPRKLWKLFATHFLWLCRSQSHTCQKKKILPFLWIELISLS